MQKNNDLNSIYADAINNALKKSKQLSPGDKISFSLLLSLINDEINKINENNKNINCPKVYFSLNSLPTSKNEIHELKESDITYRDISKEEINELISSKFRSESGMFVYNLKDKNRSTDLTKEQLQNIIKNDYKTLTLNTVFKESQDENITLFKNAVIAKTKNK